MNETAKNASSVADSLHETIIDFGYHRYGEDAEGGSGYGGAVQWFPGRPPEENRVSIPRGAILGEVYALTQRDVDLKAKALTTWENKTDHPRTVYMTKRGLDIFTRRVGAVTAPNQRLFRYHNAWLRYVWDWARIHIGFANDPNFVPYIFRHTCASRLVRHGVTINVVKEWLGHKPVQITMRYAHLAPNNLRAAADALDNRE